MKGVDRGPAGGKRIHFGKLPQGFLHFIHRNIPGTEESVLRGSADIGTYE
jgi:hypothetical protein